MTIFGWKLVKLDKIEDLNARMDIHSCYTFDMEMVDSKGRCETPHYDPNEVADMWGKYHKRVHKIKECLRELLK